MNIGTTPVSRWALSLEMLVCFVPLTLGGCVDVVLNGVFGVMPMEMWLPYLAATLVGPLALIVAFKLIVFRQPAISRATIIALCVLAAWTFVACFIQFGFVDSTSNVVSWWLHFVLIALLPAFGVAHLVHITMQRRRPLATG